MLTTEIGLGNPGQALAWRGVGSYYDGLSANFTLPAVVDTSRDVTLQFDAFLSADGPGDIQVYAKRGTCPIVAITIQRGAWRTLSRDLVACGDGTGVVVFVGEVYQFSPSLVALLVDNISLTYR
jgi:hypothetical protein